MKKTIFAGLTVLAADESIQSDNGAFTGPDREEIDRLGKIGAKLHRHTGLPGLLDPTLPASASIIGSAGTIPGGLPISLAYTLQDALGGETLPAPVVAVTTPAPLEIPIVAPVGKFDSVAGTLMADTYTYALTYTDGEGGETPVGPSVTINRPPGTEKGEIKLEGLEEGLEETEATGWRLYRARGGGEYVLLATGLLGDDTFTDDGSVAAQCDVHPPTDNVNSTNQVNTLSVKLPLDAAIEEATFINLYASFSNDFGNASFLQQFPAGSGGATVLFASLVLQNRQPPDVNRSYGGANQIDPDTELIDWHWKRPVEKEEDLPDESEGTEEGDVRVVLETGGLFVFREGEWIVYDPTGEPIGPILAAEGKGVILFGADLTKARPTKFKSYEWIGEAGGEEPENMAEFDTLIDTNP